MFFKGSRYAFIKEDQITDNSGRMVRFKKVRFIPETKAESGHRVSRGDRLDTIAHRYLNDPERFWRICDANRAMQPDELVEEPGRLISIPSPEE